MPNTSPKRKPRDRKRGTASEGPQARTANELPSLALWASVPPRLCRAARWRNWFVKTDLVVRHTEVLFGPPYVVSTRLRR